MSTRNYKLAKFIPSILRPLLKCDEHFIKNSPHLVKKLGTLTVERDECLVSYDVVSLFTQMSVNECLDIVRSRLNSDNALSDRTNLTADEIMRATELCLKSTLFVYNRSLPKQTDGVAMGSPSSPTIVNLFMEELEERLLNSTTLVPRVWWRYVDNTLDGGGPVVTSPIITQEDECSNPTSTPWIPPSLYFMAAI
ncbi:unnamed protein product [Echinostoma caproni]|uniref:Reverse transcriptase domain-containing protein n=1 Tax=Echinostoma caproni TaxID=27848 RepID=A0A183A0C0_9TREM|nr:unnamed protein product [Echinostoma caproni]